MTKDRNKTKTTYSREIIEGDIKRITKTTKTVEPVGTSKTVTNEPLPKAGSNHVATEVEPPDTPEAFGMNGCVASMINGFSWVVHPCVKILNRSTMHFNARAMQEFGLQSGTCLMMSMTASEKELRLYNVCRRFHSRNSVHREGCYRLSRPSRDLVGHTKLLTLRGQGKCGISLLGKYPGLIGHVFRLWQHPADSNILLLFPATGISLDKSVTDKLLVKERFSTLLPGLNSLQAALGTN